MSWNSISILLEPSNKTCSQKGQLYRPKAERGVWSASYPHRLVYVCQIFNQPRLCTVSRGDSVSKTFSCSTEPIIIQTGRACNNYLVKVPWCRLTVLFKRISWWGEKKKNKGEGWQWPNRKSVKIAQSDIGTDSCIDMYPLPCRHIPVSDSAQINAVWPETASTRSGRAWVQGR